MWWECLPPAMIIATCLYIPQVASLYFNKAVFDNPFRRDLSLPHGRTMFLRDCRIDGAPWKVRGLENIPDN